MTSNQAIANCEGSAQQLQDVLARALPALHRRAFRLLGNTADAEDAVQDALFAAYKKLEQFRGRSQMSTWLNAIVANCARMQLRRRPRHVHVSLDSRIGEQQELSFSETLVDRHPNPEDECHNSELNARLSKFAAELSPSLRRTFHLRHVKNLSTRETAQILGLSTGTVKSQMARARAKLVSSMQKAMRPNNVASEQLVLPC